MRLEVKSTSQELREHAFLLEQLTQQQAGGQTLVASMLLEESPFGVSVLELQDVIVRRLGSASEPRRRLETIVADSLGAAFDEAHQVKFVLDTARDSLLLFNANQIPCVAPPPPEVKRVQFTVDLSTTPPVSLEDSRQLATFFGDLLPAA